MKDISLKELLEAGCHFGHRVERWHPKAASFIYQEQEGIHIIDLLKTREALKKAALFIEDLAKNGKTILFVATKRQAKGVVTEAAKRAGIPYLTARWIGGFITNWEEVKKNIGKLNNFRRDQKEGAWQKFPKHEIVKLEKMLRQLETVYQGVADLNSRPDSVFMVDARKEIACFREALRLGIKTVAIVDTNTNPTNIDYPIPANDDAVGSIQYVVNYLVEVYIAGTKLSEKKEAKEEKSQVGGKELEPKLLVKEEKVNKEKTKKRKLLKKV